MEPNSWRDVTKVSVGTTPAVLASAYDSRKRVTWISSDRANTGIIYFGGSGVTVASGFGELVPGQAVPIAGSAALYVIASVASQNVRVLEGVA